MKFTHNIVGSFKTCDELLRAVRTNAHFPVMVEVGKCHFPIISEQVLSDAVNAAFSLARHLGEETVQVL